ncbi:virulence factor SrfB [Flavobacterium sp. ACAM 123]|uniref:virulence factor SrfB n=1 Tax=Flavobacterium sp. ACAM 123 TaxID=1189620 RepID=UPI00031ACBCC|nr:virulence factor SrfB [Flavobacterium sp. ACAM 123]
MKRISLISNSSIQYHKFESEINLDFAKTNKLYFHQPFDTNILDFTLDPLFKVTIDGDEKYYRKQELQDNDYIVNNKLKEEVDLNTCKEIVDVYEASNLKKAIKNFKKKWIPLPYFKDNSINKDVMYPTDWARLYFDCDDEYKKVKIVLAIDTTLAKNESDKTGPQLSLNPEENIFKIHTNEINISNFLFSTNASTSWIEGYLADMFYGKNDELRYEQPIKQYISHYILLVKWIASLKETPELQLFTDETTKIPVDLVIDIGNSATCALLFENDNDAPFTFEKVKKIIIQDYSNPQLEYNEPFPMNLVFSESNFGTINQKKYHNNKFIVPSFMRIGYEAETLINNSSINLNLGYELKTHNSSPKRYLWDKNPAEKEWEFYPTDFNKIKKVYLSGISEQLKIDGALTNGEVFGSKSMFSRNSLMKFVFLELLIHSYVQINSYKFREDHGNLTIPRTLKRITISCPTGMIQHEQIALREAAEDACKLLNNYVKYYFDSNENKFWFELPEIIPSIKDIAKKLPDLEERKDWIYDEATSCQLVFIYSLLSKKLQGNNYVIDNYLFKNKDKITVGSVDIGAGTSDVMIASYSLNKDDKTINIKPDPQYWDSFKIAGDDLLKEIIQQVIIEGTVNSPSDEGCTGVIENYAKSKGIENVSEKLNGFFGQDSNNIGYVAKMMRKAFIHQVAIPLAMHYLKNANGQENASLSFEQIIGKDFKNKELIKYFERHFGFNFLDIRWNINPSKINAIVSSVFDSMVKQLCLVLNQYQCDYIVLSGKPCSLNSLEEIFLKYLTISPNNLINLNTYWIGKWFPFSDNRGFVEDPKTMVSVGAIIALMAGKLKKINDLKIDTEIIKQKLISTADYIVKSNFNTKEIILTPSKNENSILVHSLPYQFGYAKYISKNYPVSDLYNISLDNKEIRKTIKNRFPNRENTFYEDQINIEKNKINQNFPLKITLSREIDDSKEQLKIESVEDVEGNDKSNKFFKLNYQTLDNENGYWLDTCEFILNAR